MAPVRASAPATSARAPARTWGSDLYSSPAAYRNLELFSYIGSKCATLWLSDGLAKNSLASYRSDLILYADWLKHNGYYAGVLQIKYFF